MRIRTVLTSCLAVAALGLAGLPGFASDQASPAASLDNVVNKDGLLITLDKSDPKALLGGESIIKGAVKNNGAVPLFNAGWTVQLPQGVSFVSAEAGPGDYGSPKVTGIIHADGSQSTVVYWNNAADLSPGVEATFEIKVTNNGPEKGSKPETKKKFYTPGETFNAKAWAGASTVATVLPRFQEFGFAGANLDKEAAGPQSSREWASDTQPVKIEGLLPKITLTNLIEDVALRGNQPLQRQIVEIDLKRTTKGDLNLTKPVTISIDPEWEIMGKCVRIKDCFTPTEDQVRWVAAPKPHWEVDVPADKFDFKGGSEAKAYLEIAALDKTNVDPEATGVKVNPAGYGGNGDDAANPDDVARRGESAAAYANNTGPTTQNTATVFVGNATTGYDHPWNAVDAAKYPNQPDIPVDIPEVKVRIEDAGVKLTTKMDAGGPYKQNGPVTKTLVVKTDEYTRLPANREITMALPAEECFVNPGTTACVESGEVTFTKTTEGLNGSPVPTQVKGIVTKTPEGKFVLTIPAASISEATSTTETFDIKTKVRQDIDGTPVVNGKPLETVVNYSWGDGPIKVSSDADIPPAKPAIFTTVAFPTGGNGACPAPLGAIPNPKEIKEDEATRNRTVDELNGAEDKWGKYRRVRAGDELCFQINVEFPEGITTRDPVLNVYLPSETDLKGTVDDIAFTGSLAGAKKLDPSSAIPEALNHVAKPELRKPLIYTFGDYAPGSSKVTLVYKTTVKNAGVVDPSGPQVIFDNLGKLTFKDQKGEFHNSRDAAGYGFVSPLLMISVDKNAVTAKRGETVPLAYTVTNIGGGPARDGARVVVRIPEGFSCDTIKVGGEAEVQECVTGVKPGDRGRLLSGDYAILKLKGPINAATDKDDSDTKKFTVSFKVADDRAPGSSHFVDVGVVSYQNGNSHGEPIDTTYFPIKNTYCKHQGNPSADAAEAMDKQCTIKASDDLLKKPVDPAEFGRSVILAPDKAAHGRTAMVNTRITVTNPSIVLSGDSTDMTQKPEPALTVVPGEKGNIRVRVLPNPADPSVPNPGPESLVGSTVPGNTWIDVIFSGVDTTNADNQDTRPFARDEVIRDAVAKAFGQHVDPSKVEIKATPGDDGKYIIHIPLESIPTKEVAFSLPQVFTTTTKPPKVEATYRLRPVQLYHRDLVGGKPRLNQPPVQNAPTAELKPNPVQYLRKVPVVEVAKVVKTPNNARIAGGDDIAYEVKLTNTSDVTAYGVQLTDTLPELFTHKADLTGIEVAPAALDPLKGQTSWTLSNNGRVGVWPAAAFELPAGGTVTIKYVATASRTVTANEAYANVVGVPFKSMAVDGPGVETYNAKGEANVRGHDVKAVTTITPQVDRHGNGKVQHGETVKTVTTLTIPNNVKVPNLSLLSVLAGANIDPAKAKVDITCPAGVPCKANPVLLPGSNGEKLGVVVSDQPIENTSGSPITITIETTDLLVTNGDGPITVKGDAYRGPAVPTDIPGFKDEDKASSGSFGQVEIMKPALDLTSTLVSGFDGKNDGNPVSNPIEPGTPNLHVRFVVKNPTPDSDARHNVINVKDTLAAVGLKVDPNYNDPRFDGTNLLIPSVKGEPVKVFIPVVWDMTKYGGANPPTGEQRTPVEILGQTGPLNAVPGAKDPETVGQPIKGNASLALTPVYRPAPPPVIPPPAIPAPQPTPTPTPDPDPGIAGDRPTEIPPAPKPPAKPAPAKPGHTPSGDDAEQRSTNWVDATIPDGEKARIVLIGRDNVFADSLSSGGLQGILDAPLLLNPVTHLSERTKKNLDRLKPEQVIILGGPVAQSPAVEEELKKLGWNVSRVHGPTRVETAIDAATVHAPEATDGVLARAYAANWSSGTQAFADALGGGAFAARKQHPVFLTQTDELTATLKEYLPKSKIKHLTIVGSTEAVSPAVEAELNKMGIKTTRVAGTNRAETAVKLANAQGYWHAGEAESALVVNGESEDAWTDAFPAALFAKRYELPVVLTGKDALLPETKTWILPGQNRKPPTRVICGYSVGNVKECGYSPTTAKTNEN